MEKLEQVLERLAPGARAALRGDGAAVRLLNGDGKHLLLGAASGLGATSKGAEGPKLEASSLDEEALAGSAVVIADARGDDRSAGLPGSSLHPSRRVICVIRDTIIWPIIRGHQPLC